MATETGKRVLADVDLVCTDALEGISNLEDESVGLVFTSPPYNVGVDYGVYGDDLPVDEYIGWLCRVFESVECKVVPGGHVVIQLANTGPKPYLPKTDLLATSLNWSLVLRGEVIWDKQNSTNQTAWGSWRSPNMPSIRDLHEYLLIFRKEGKRKGVSDLSAKEFPLLTRSIWRIAPEGKRLHPAPFPLALAECVVKLFSFVDELVLDPFMGSGTTGVACVNLGRRFIGFDINSEYVELARARIAEAGAQQKLGEVFSSEEKT